MKSVVQFAQLICDKVKNICSQTTKDGIKDILLAIEDWDAASGCYAYVMSIYNYFKPL